MKEQFHVNFTRRHNQHAKWFMEGNIDALPGIHTDMPKLADARETFTALVSSQ
jgi:hypothetical protein